jgi:hypothetical protein
MGLFDSKDDDFGIGDFKLDSVTDSLDVKNGTPIENYSLVEKIFMVILSIVVFIILLIIGTKIIIYFLSPSKSPYLIKNTVNAENQMVISTNPNVAGSIPIYRSVNEDNGVEFSWSCWINITDLQYGYGKYKHVFHKGNDSVGDNGIIDPNNAPGLYIHPTQNALVVVMNTYTTINEEILITNIPLNKWINVIIIVNGNVLSVYVNGTLVKLHQLSDVPKQNYGDVYVAMNGGFNGYISKLRYFDYAVQPGEIQYINYWGPSNALSITSDLQYMSNPYLSLRWYFQ